jgi:RNA polymerase sigma factor (sigma-70 family)
LSDPTPDVRHRAFDALARTYWTPVYTYIRLRWKQPREAAEDLTQEFFTRALQRDFLADYDPARARFRTFLRVCVDRLVANEQQAARRLKRGGGAAQIPLDSGLVEAQIAARPAGELPADDEFFRQEVVRTLFAGAVASLRTECEAANRMLAFRLFEAYDLLGPDAIERPTYVELARKHGIPVTQVTNRLASVRRRFRALVLDELRALSGSDAEYRAEAREILGVDPP